MGNTLTVACADPKGIILRVFDFIEVREPSRDNTEKTVKRSIEIGRIKLNGYWSNIPDFMRKDAKAMRMQYGLTHNVDEDLFKKWYEANKENPICKNRVVFAHPKAEYAHDKAKDKEKLMEFRGSDPLDPTMLVKEGRVTPKDPRYPRPAPAAGLEPHVTAAER